MSAINHSIKNLPPLTVKKIGHDGLCVNGLRYNHPELASHIGVEVMVFPAIEPNAIAVFINGKELCIATVCNAFAEPHNDVGREAVIVEGEYSGAAGLIMQVNCSSSVAIYHIRLYGGEALHSYCRGDFMFTE